MSSDISNTAAIRQQLLARQSELIARSAHLRADRGRVLEPLSHDAPDRAIQQENDEVVDSIDEAVTSELRAIDQAMTRLEQGRYGVCTSCGHPIGARRLKAVPYADQCQSCVAQASS